MYTFGHGEAIQSPSISMHSSRRCRSVGRISYPFSCFVALHSISVSYKPLRRSTPFVHLRSSYFKTSPSHISLLYSQLPANPPRSLYTLLAFDIPLACISLFTLLATTTTSTTATKTNQPELHRPILECHPYRFISSSSLLCNLF